MIEKSGVATQDLIAGAYPDANRRAQGAFAVVECFQKIPCNPCYSSCPRGAMKRLEEDINDLPKVFFDKCNGCAACVSNCPGLAIFVIDETFSPTQALVKMPYEFLPLPKKGDTVTGLNREGKAVCEAVVHNVVNGKAQDRTPIVWLAVPKEFSAEVRSLKIKDADCDHGDCVKIENITPSTDENAYVCRCEEITVKTIRELISKGYTTLDEIKVVSRAGMGSCQGRTCRQLIMNELSRQTGQKHNEMHATTFRPPVKPIKMGLLCKTGKESENE